MNPVVSKLSNSKNKREMQKVNENWINKSVMVLMSK